MSVVVITGCSTGIGFATTEVLARKGHTVYTTMRNPDRSPELAQLAQRDNLPINILTLDVDSDESVKNATRQVLAEAGHVDVLFNNAGIAPLNTVEETPLEVYRRVMETNYFGVLRCIQAVLPSMRQRKSGLIINNSSIAGIIYPPHFGAYCATKAALEALSESLAGEVEQFGIRVAVIQPLLIYTPIMQKIEPISPDTHYPNISRARAFLLSAKDNNVPTSEVANVINEIISGDRTGFRHPIGPAAEPLIGYRASLSDKDWIASAAIDEETWISGMEQMGLNVRPYLASYADTQL